MFDSLCNAYDSKPKDISNTCVVAWTNDVMGNIILLLDVFLQYDMFTVLYYCNTKVETRFKYIMF